MQEATLETSCGKSFPLAVRLDTPAEIDYYLSGGILPYVLNQILDQQGALASGLTPYRCNRHRGEFYPSHAPYSQSLVKAPIDFLRFSFRSPLMP